MSGKYKKSQGNAGLDGVQFQLNLLTVILLNTLRRHRHWKISTENQEAGKYDDIVLELPGNTALLFQAKRKDNRKITKEQLFSSNSRTSEFSLPKYFFSYYEIKSKFKVESVFVCTNTDINPKGLGKIINFHDIGNDCMLHSDGGNSSCLTFSDSILPELKASVAVYHENNLQGKSIDHAIISDDNLIDFLEHLKFIVNYPSGEYLNKIIEQLLSRLDGYNLADKVSYSEMYRKVEDWFKQKSGEYLTEARVAAMFSEIQSDRFCRELKCYNVSFETNDIDFADSNKLFHVNEGGGYLLRTLKIFDALQKDKAKKLYVNPMDNIEIQKRVIDAFELSRYTFLIIVWIKSEIDCILNEISEKFTDILKKYDYKKVILVGESSDDLIQRVRKNFNVLSVNGSVTFDDLSNGTRKRLKKNKNIIFQGRRVDLEELLGTQTVDHYARAVNSEILQKLIRNEEVKVGAPVLDSHADTTLCYISRTFKKSIEDDGSNEQETFPEENLFDEAEKVILIADSAGMGKSIVLAKLETIIKHRYPQLWVIRIELCHYTRILRKFLENNKQAINAVELLNSEGATQLTNHLERFAFGMDKKVVLMLDGVDEISPDYTELVLNLLKQCMEAANFAKIFVTTRPHLVHKFETKIDVKPFVMLPFTKANQTDFLTSYWVYNLGLVEDETKAKCLEYSKALIRKMSSWTNRRVYKQNDFTAVPLQLRMLAEIFTENAGCDDSTNWEGCIEYLNGIGKEPRLPHKMDIAKLYDMFIKKKRDIFIYKANPNGNPSANKALIDQFDKCRVYYQNWALKLIVGNANCTWSSDFERDDKDIETDALKIGIVQKVANKFHFVHRTFAEYYVAESLVKELLLRNKNANFQRFFIEEVLCKSSFKIVRTFLDSFLRNVVDLLPRNLFKKYQSNVYLYEDLEDRINYYNPVFVLVEDGCLEILRLFLKCVNFKVKTKDVTIHKRDNVWVNLVRKLGLQVNDNKGNVLNIMRRLIHQGGINMKTEYEETPLHRAAKHGHFEMVKFLIRQGANVNAKCRLQNGSLRAFRSGRLNTYNDFININALDGYTPLHFAAWYGHLDIVKYFAEIEADVCVRNCRGQTPLHIAAHKDQLDVVKYFVQIGVDASIRDRYDCTIMSTAVKNNQLDIIKYLVSINTDVNYTDANGDTVMHIAARRGVLDVVKYFIELGINVNPTNNDGSTALHLAAARNKLSVIKYFVEIGADFRAKNNDGRTALYLAVMQGHLGVIKYLVDLVVELSFRQAASDTAARHILIFEHLEEFGADIGIKNTIDNAKLDEAIKGGRLDVIKQLVEIGVYVTTRNECGCTILHLAAKNGTLDTVRYLVKLGVDVNIKDDEGRTALEVAEEFGCSKVFDYLVQWFPTSDPGH